METNRKLEGKLMSSTLDVKWMLRENGEVFIVDIPLIPAHILRILKENPEERKGVEYIVLLQNGKLFALYFDSVVFETPLPEIADDKRLSTLTLDLLKAEDTTRYIG